MATTVFPVTDQTATVALFSALKNAADRGDPSVIVSVNAIGAIDTDRLQYTHVGAVSTTNTTFRNLTHCNIDEGQVFLVEISISVEDGTATSPGDYLDFKITVPTGVRATGIHFASYPSSDIMTADFIDTTTSQVFQARSSASSPEITENRIHLVITGESGGGQVDLQYAKQTNTYSNTFSDEDVKLIARRIL
jgi:hypothetical protein